MPRKPIGERPLTNAERVGRHRQRLVARAEALRIALVQVKLAKTLQGARQIADEALSPTQG